MEVKKEAEEEKQEDQNEPEGKATNEAHDLGHKADYRVLSSSALHKFIIYRPDLISKTGYQFGGAFPGHSRSNSTKISPNISQRTSFFKPHSSKMTQGLKNPEYSSVFSPRSTFGGDSFGKTDEKDPKLKFPSQKESKKFQKTITGESWMASVKTRNASRTSSLPFLKETRGQGLPQQGNQTGRSKAPIQFLKQTSSSGFFPFTELVSQDPSIHDQILNLETNAYDPQLFYQNQLMFNRIQHQMAQETMEKYEKTANDFFRNEYIAKQKLLFKLSKSIKHRPSKKQSRSLSQILSEKGSILKKLVENETKKAKIAIFPTNKVKVFAKEINSAKWRPSARECGTFVTSDYGARNDFVGILYGGLSHSLHGDLSFYFFDKDDWRRYDIQGSLKYQGRFGHTFSYYRLKKCFILFGGSLLYSVISKTMESLSEVAVFSPEKKSFQSLRTMGDCVVESRHSHIAEIIHNKLIVYGGINSKGNYLNNAQCLDLGKVPFLH